MFQSSWAERILTPAIPGRIRLFGSPDNFHPMIQKYWYADMSLKQWIHLIESISAEVTETSLFFHLYPEHFVQTVKQIFITNQRVRWLAWKVVQRWRIRIWMKRTQCNIDMIDMEPVADRDAIFVTDTRHRQIHRFHRRDVFQNLISNIGMSDEMLPYPRQPTNPWTNSPLTLAQTMSVCEQLVMDYAKRGKCPPVMFAAFCAARFDLKRFQADNSSLLAQHAICSYYSDLSSDNQESVYETILQLLTDANLHYSPSAIHRWLYQTPQTVLHAEWLRMVRDYTLYINLHVQIRPTWVSTAYIVRDVRRLYNRMTPSHIVNPPPPQALPISPLENDAENYTFSSLLGLSM